MSVDRLNSKLSNVETADCKLEDIEITTVQSIAQRFFLKRLTPPKAIFMTKQSIQTSNIFIVKDPERKEAGKESKHENLVLRRSAQW